jgi:hypothetical protein
MQEQTEVTHALSELLDEDVGADTEISVKEKPDELVATR